VCRPRHVRAVVRVLGLSGVGGGGGDVGDEEAVTLHAELRALQVEAGAPAVAAQFEPESKIEAKLKTVLSYSSFKRLVPGALNMGFVGSTCTALLRPPPGPRMIREEYQRGPGIRHGAMARAKAWCPLLIGTFIADVRGGWFPTARQACHRGTVYRRCVRGV
jgi:hypothetical protein